MHGVIQLVQQEKIGEYLWMFKLFIHMQAMNADTIARQLFECAASAGNSEHKRAWLINLPKLILEQAQLIAEGRYPPQPLTVFAVTDPKLREIFAPAFSDRLVHQWLVHHIEPWWDKRFIDDSFANRKGKGSQAAVTRLQHFMRKPDSRWYLKLDIAAFFPSIDRRIVLQLWQQALPNLPYPYATRRCLDQVAQAILRQSPVEPAPHKSGDLSLLRQVPPHKSLFHAAPDRGMPIGSLTSQFFANVYMNELDQFIKHQLRVRAYVRYVDDFVLMAYERETLQAWQAQIADFLQQHLHLQLHPHKQVLQRANQGIDFLGYIVHPHYCLARQRCVRALRRRIAWFKYLLFPATERAVPQPPAGTWQRWLGNHAVTLPNGAPSPAVLQRMLSTLNSYYGVFAHAETYRLRKHIYHHELGPLKRYFLPSGPDYSHLRVRSNWLRSRR